MKVIIAPNTTTINRVTSEGDVVFENGVADKFTKKQAEFFKGIPGFEVKDSEDGIHPDLKDDVVEDLPESDVTETPELPTPNDKLKDIIDFANAQGVDIAEVNTNTKKPVLEAIYAHFGK